jgi:hypothetical protein
MDAYDFNCLRMNDEGNYVFDPFKSEGLVDNGCLIKREITKFDSGTMESIKKEFRKINRNIPQGINQEDFKSNLTKIVGMDIGKPLGKLNNVIRECRDVVSLRCKTVASILLSRLNNDDSFKPSLSSLAAYSEVCRNCLGEIDHYSKRAIVSKCLLECSDINNLKQEFVNNGYSEDEINDFIYMITTLRDNHLLGLGKLDEDAYYYLIGSNGNINIINLENIISNNGMINYNNLWSNNLMNGYQNYYMGK